jgi:hypothetical protein
MSGSRDSTEGRRPTAWRNWSAIASFTLSVMKSRLFTGLRCALVSTLNVRSALKWWLQRTALAPW